MGNKKTGADLFRPNAVTDLNTSLNITPLPEVTPVDPTLGLGSLNQNNTGPQTLLNGTDSITGEFNKPSGIPDNSGSGIGFSMGDAIGVGQLGLGYLQYKDTKKYNNKAIQAMDQNIKLAQTEADATAKYRKSYGA